MDRLGWILDQARTVEKYNSIIDGMIQYSDSISVREVSNDIYAEVEALRFKLAELSAQYEVKYKDRDY